MQHIIDHMIIAIDGYSSCGKSTVAKSVAKKLGFRYIDSGAMYRAVTYYFLQSNIPIVIDENGAGLPDYKRILSSIQLEFRINAEHQSSELFMNDKNVEHDIRKMEVSEQVSHVSRIGIVRETLVNMQRSYGQHHDLVMDGRDIGTTVFPEAEVKVFMTADLRIRAERRYLELKMNGIDINYDAVLENIRSRDDEDSMRSISPLTKAKDAIVLDNSDMNFEEQLNFVLQLVETVKSKI